MTAGTARRVRTDRHRPSAIDPADYGYVGAFDTDCPDGNGERLAAAVENSRTSVYRSPGRCDHCGAHLRYCVVWRHEPTREHIATGEICARETMVVPDRMTLDLKRLKNAAKAGKDRESARAASRELHPEAVAVLDRYARDGGPNPFVRDVARRFGESGWLSEKQATAVVDADRREITPGRAADRADLRRRERGRALSLAGKVRRVGEGRYEVQGSGGKVYAVSLDPESCLCPDAEKGHRCKHVYAALLAERAFRAERDAGA